MAASRGYVVGIGGQARSGKDTLGSCLWQRLNGLGQLGHWDRHGFAQPVKRLFREIAVVIVAEGARV